MGYADKAIGNFSDQNEQVKAVSTGAGLTTDELKQLAADTTPLAGSVNLTAAQVLTFLNGSVAVNSQTAAH